MTLKDLRIKANLTQEQLAGLLFVNSSTIRKWESGTAVPDFATMKNMADVLNTDLYTITRLFAPKDTTFSKHIDEVKEAYEAVSGLFKDASNVDCFFMLILALSAGKTKGMFLSEERTFLFSHIIADNENPKADIVIFMDDNRNRVVMKKSHIVEVNPLSYSNDNFNFKILFDYPVFPDNSQYIPDKFQQSVRMVVFFDN